MKIGDQVIQFKDRQHEGVKAYLLVHVVQLKGCLSMILPRLLRKGIMPSDR